MRLSIGLAGIGAPPSCVIATVQIGGKRRGQKKRRGFASDNRRCLDGA